MKRRTLAAAAMLAAALAGCAGMPERSSDAIGGEAFSGRLSVRVEANGDAPARSLTAAFELQGSAEAGRLDLSTPLGSILAQARWAPREVVLVTPRGEARYADLDALTRDVLGESVPVAAMFDWLRGRPWPGAPSQPQATGFEQLGWQVDVADLAAQSAIAARRDAAPAVVVRARLDPR